MNTKLTVSIQKGIFEKARAIAKSRGSSLTELIENYLRALVSEQSETPSAPITETLRGALKDASVRESEVDYNQNLTDILSKKYLNDGQSSD